MRRGGAAAVGAAAAGRDFFKSFNQLIIVYVLMLMLLRHVRGHAPAATAIEISVYTLSLVRQFGHHLVGSHAKGLPRHILLLLRVLLLLLLLDMIKHLLSVYLLRRHHWRLLRLLLL